MEQQRSLPVPDALEGERVDTALARLLGMSRTRAAELAESGAVVVDEKLMGKSDRLPAGGWLTVELPDIKLAPPPEPVPGMVVRYEDDDLVVIDKPIGVAAHPSPGWEGPTVVGALAAAGFQVAASGPAEREGIVHRLDAGTSGLMIVAKSDVAYSVLKRAFKQRTVTRRYHAVVQGIPDPAIGTIDAPVGRHPKADYKFAVVTDGRHAVTHYRVLEAMPHASLVEVTLETGRTHQIRVHMSAIGHPCVGDLTYGADPTLAGRVNLRRQWLHAMLVAFDHPRTGTLLEVTSDYPDDLQAALDTLRAQS